MRKLYAEEPFDSIIKFELTRVLIRFEDTLNEGRNYLLELLLHTSNRSYAMLELGKLEASVGNYEEAKSCFNELLETSDWIYGVENLLFLSIKEENYEEASQLLNTIYNANLIDDNQLSNIVFYLKYKLNLLTETDKKQNKNYFCLQLLDYNREAAINHIKVHLDENDFKNRILYFLNQLILKIFFLLLKEVFLKQFQINQILQINIKLIVIM